MGFGSEGDQRLVLAIRLPIRVPFSPITFMRRESKTNLVMAEVLRCLVVVLTLSGVQPGRIDERQAEGAIVGLIGTVLGIGEYGHAGLAALIGEIEPVVRSHFEFLRIVG